MEPLANIKASTRAYEEWLRTHGPVLKPDLKAKHEKMSKDAFSFLRATYYRWVQCWPARCPELARAPLVPSVGDLHVENFGTWRDAEGRLIWGINDFDEAASLPYTNDLVRLATSALLALAAGELSISGAVACNAIARGYAESLSAGGLPFVLSERHGWLRDLATNSLRDPVRFWAKLTRLSRIKRQVPPKVLQILRATLPHLKLPFRVVHRRSGLGSLGRARYTALAEWQGGWIAREAKWLLPPASGWQGKPAPQGISYATVMSQAVRATDPFVTVHGPWVVRRLSPYCSRIDLDSLPRGRDENDLLHAMGWETANIHLGNPRAAAAAKRDLKKQKVGWLLKAAKAIAKGTEADWREWRG